MAKLDLSAYTDKELVSAILSLPAHKFMNVLNAIAAISEKAQRRGVFLAKEMSDEVVEELMRRIVEGDK